MFCHISWMDRGNTMTIEEMRNKKMQLGLTNEMISESSGIPLSTIQKIMSGATKAPRKNALEAIESVLYSEELRRIRTISAETIGKSDLTYDTSGEPSPVLLKESAGNYNYVNTASKKDGEYTLDDYYALPDERRVELINGVFYDMSAPTVFHQKILGELFLLFRECADAHEGECEVCLSPCDVRLDCDNRTMVQPDLFVVCRPYDLNAKAFDGAPDLTLEILSPSTRAKDMLLKLHKYQSAGVKEYWIVDPDHSTILVYDLRSDDFYPNQYDFDSVIPILISDGKCSIDFSRVSRALRGVVRRYTDK